MTQDFALQIGINHQSHHQSSAFCVIELLQHHLSFLKLSVGDEDEDDDDLDCEMQERRQCFVFQVMGEASRRLKQLHLSLTVELSFAAFLQHPPDSLPQFE